MNVLIVGGGGREHALAYKVASSPVVERLLVAPGNPGCASLERTQVFPQIKADDLAGLLELARNERVDLVVVGPEAPLVAGLAERLHDAGIAVFGPDARGAMLEGSKIWAKELMRKHAIPTAESRTFEDYERAVQYLDHVPLPVVIKADGLAAGKGVTVARERDQAIAVLRRIMLDKAFGEAGRRVLIEDFLSGPEVSVLAICDGKTLLPLPSAQDHKAVYDDDRGPNTGGMGAYCPAPVYTPALARDVDEKILVPIVHALHREQIDYRGVIYAGLMLTKNGPRVLEFNVRFGDPELQALVPRLPGDWVPLLHAAAEGRLETFDSGALVEDQRPSVCVVLTSGGYPGDYRTGYEITGLDDVAATMPDVLLFHAGTARDEAGKLVTAGGRVLNVIAQGNDFAAARARAYEAVEKIHFTDRHVRTDIGRKALDLSA